jgi:hypothetical protein
MITFCYISSLVRHPTHRMNQPTSRFLGQGQPTCRTVIRGCAAPEKEPEPHALRRWFARRQHDCCSRSPGAKIGRKGERAWASYRGSRHSSGEQLIKIPSLSPPAPICHREATILALCLAMSRTRPKFRSGHPSDYKTEPLLAGR